MLTNSKKAEMGISTMMRIAIVLIVVVILLSYLYPSILKLGFGFNSEITQTEDSDRDGVINLQDECDCIKGEYDSKYKGCPRNSEPSNDRSCITNAKKT